MNASQYIFYRHEVLSCSEKKVPVLIYSFVLNQRHLVGSQFWQRPGMKQGCGWGRGCVHVCMCVLPREMYLFAAMGE